MIHVSIPWYIYKVNRQRYQLKLIPWLLEKLPSRCWYISGVWSTFIWLESHQGNYGDQGCHEVLLMAKFASWKRGDCWLDFLPTRSWQRVILPHHPTISCISCHVKVRSMIALLWRHFKRLGTKFCYQVSLWVGSVIFLTGRLFQSLVTTQKILHSSSFNKSEHFKQSLILHVLKLKPNLL